MRSLLILSMLTGVMASPLQADSTEPGEALYKQHCTGCHGTEVMTRKNRRVNDLHQLAAQVRACDSNLGLKWFDDDIEAVSAYLNQRFYQFKARD
jgi:cytochrome c